MKRIDVVELYVKKRIEKLVQIQGEYKVNEKEITELNDVLDVINQVNTSKKSQESNKFDAFVYSLSKLNQQLQDVEEE